MLMLLALLTATPTPCEALWPTVWKALPAKELPDAKERLGRAWIAECRAFTPAALDCAMGVTHEIELLELRRALEKRNIPKQTIDEGIAKARADWSPLHCPEVARALDRARAGLAADARDAGVPRSDDCAGADLASGKCQCAHHQCMDSCCPEGWACAHSGATTAKCVRPR
jgi:hypothetical protein